MVNTNSVNSSFETCDARGESVALNKLIKNQLDLDLHLMYENQDRIMIYDD